MIDFVKQGELAESTSQRAGGARRHHRCACRAPTADARAKGAKQAFEAAGPGRVSQPGIRQHQSLNVAQNVSKRTPDLKGSHCANDVRPAAAQAVEEAGKTGRNTWHRLRWRVRPQSKMVVWPQVLRSHLISLVTAVAATLKSLEGALCRIPEGAQRRHDKDNVGMMEDQQQARRS
jgi:hypothetical protein